MTAAGYPIPRCRFYARTAVDGGWSYTPVSVDSREGDGALPTPYPPPVGDLIWLTDRFTGSGAVFRVLERQWMHAGYGSMSWRAGTAAPAEGPMLEIVVEAAGGLFLDEVDCGDDG